MSVKYMNSDHFLIDHSDFISSLYQEVYTNGKTTAFEVVKNLFSILCTPSSSSKRKRARDSDEYLNESIQVKTEYKKFLQALPTEVKDDIFNKYNLMGTSEVRDLAKKLFETTLFDLKGMNGGNNSDVPLKCKIKDEYFLIPPKCRFYCGCVKDQCAKLKGSKFDIVIADPPWWNKYIRRLKSANDKLSYSMMHNEDIASIPVSHLLSDNCLIAVWCTNAPSNITAVKDRIFPSWGVQYLATWYWMKVTIDLKPLCDFSSGCKKQPFERLILGKLGDVKDIPDSQLIVSVPSALHSHKPPLLDILSRYVKVENPETLELFARYLLPNTTSVGFEPLKWQHISLYEEVS